MFLRNGKKFSIDVAVTIGDVSFPVGYFRDPEARAAHGITEVPDPVWPTPADEYFVTENEDGTLNAVRKPQGIIDAQNVIKARNAADLADLADARGIVALKYLVEHTNAEIRTFLQSNIDVASVTDLPSAKACLNRIENRLEDLAVGLAVLVRRELREDVAP